jgi:hypothetical protein
VQHSSSGRLAGPAANKDGRLTLGARSIDCGRAIVTVLTRSRVRRWASSSIRNVKSVTRHNDAFGLEIRAYFKGGPASEIIERDDGYVAAGSTGRYFAEFNRWPRRQKHGMKFVRGKNALDVGCGAG